MKQLIVLASQHPQIKAVCATIVAEATHLGVKGSYDYFMDMLAHKIAVYMHELEKQEK
jgi:hypothetical protein